MTRKQSVGHGVTLRAVNVRSASLERDLDTAELDRLTLTGRGNDVLRRVDDALKRPQRTRAWSVTGPYGSGKSSFALLLANLVSTDSSRRAAALDRVRDTDPTLAAAFEATMSEHAPKGMLRAIAGARREPVTRTVVRALNSAISDAQAIRATSAATKARKALAGADTERPGHGTAEAILEAVRALTTAAPVLLVVDEFGKTLEYQAAAGDDPGADLFLLQELSELSASDRGVPLFLMTLQHLGFLDYAGATDSLQRREWSKIQGRFEDVLFVEDATESARLLARTIRQPTPEPAPLPAYGVAAASAWEDAGLSRVLTADAELFRKVYPLHPLVTVVAPMLFGSLAQNDRTLTGFLAGDEPNTLAQYLQANLDGTSGEPESFPTMKLPALYDYLASGARTSLLASSSAARWLEIESRVSEARALATADVEVLKTVAVLNLVDAGGALRASADNIAFALLEPTDWADRKKRQKAVDRLKRPTIKGFLTYRDFSDEWRLWQGSDIDLVARVEAARASLAKTPAADLVPRSMLPLAVVAGRHAQSTGMLRYFEVLVTDSNDPIVAPANRNAEDGLLVFHLGTTKDLPPVVGDKPVVIGKSPDAKLVIDAAVEARACQLVLDGEGLDVPAAAELRERLAQSKATLAATIAEAFRPERPDVRWHYTDDRLQGSRSLSALVSIACDRAYASTPLIRNEMLGRHTLTSQGAKARRVMLEKCLMHSTEPLLGMKGYGPERAMYSGVLEYLGLHETREAEGAAAFTVPLPGGSAQPAWTAMTELLLNASKPLTLDSVYTLLMAPPYGVKSGVVPVLLVAALQIHRDDLAFFDDGTYQPKLEPAHLERLVKTPERFSVTASGATKGARAELLAALAPALNIRVPDGTAPRLLRVVNALLSRVRDLDTYAQRTSNVSDLAKAVRAIALTASDPVQLVFTALPEAVGEPPVPPGSRSTAGSPAVVVERLTAALAELESVSGKLQKSIIKTLCDAFGTKLGLAQLRTDLMQRGTALKGTQLEPGLAGLVNHALGELPTEDWLEPLVLMVCNRSLSMWTDHDLPQLAAKARQLNAALQNARTLHSRGQDARLLSLTTKDGSDMSLVLDRAPDPALQPILKDAIRQARATHGAAAATELLHLLLQQVLNDTRNTK